MCGWLQSAGIRCACDCNDTCVRRASGHASISLAPWFRMAKSVSQICRRNRTNLAPVTSGHSSHRVDSRVAAFSQCCDWQSLRGKSFSQRPLDVPSPHSAQAWEWLRRSATMPQRCPRGGATVWSERFSLWLNLLIVGPLLEKCPSVYFNTDLF